MAIGVEIRTAAPTDGAGMLLVHAAAIGAVDPLVYSDDVRDSWAHGLRAEGYAEAMADGEDFEVAVDRSGRILAFCGVRSGEVMGLFVHPEAQGAGLGAALLRRGEERARMQKPDADALPLEASLNAAPFYERHGYKVVSIRERGTRGGQIMAVAYMRKSVQQRPPSWRS